MDTKNISLSYADFIGQDCYNYVVTLSKSMTVREFINEWVNEAKSEWGTIIIANTNNYYSYSHGKATEYRIGRETANAVIDHVAGYGGWSRSDFTIFIKEGKL